MIGMAVERPLLDQLRQAIRKSGRTAYRIAKDAKVDEGNLSRFLSGQAGASVETAEKICKYLGFRLSLIKTHKQPRSRKGR